MKHLTYFKAILTALLLIAVPGVSSFSQYKEVARVADVMQDSLAPRLRVPENRLRPAKRDASVIPMSGNKITKAPRIQDSANMKADVKDAMEVNSTIYGWLGFVDTDDPNVFAGFTQVFLDGNYSCIFPYNGVTSFGFWIRDEKVCTYGYHEFFGIIFANQYDEYDMASGKVLSSTPLPASDHSHIVLTHAYDPLSDMIYGFTYNEAGTGYKWFTAPGSNPTDITHVRDVDAGEFCVAMTVNQITHELVGINSRKQIVRIDTENGLQTELGKINLDFDYVTGMCYCPIDGFYLWNEVDRGTEISHLYSIDPETYSLTELAVCRDMANYTGLYCTDKRALDPGAPQDPVLKQMNFKDGELNGYLVYATPVNTVDGKKITERLSYTALLDGEKWTSGTIPAGNDLLIPYSGLSNDYHAFTLSLSLCDKQSRDSYIRKWIGHDIPLKPETVEFENGLIQWTPVEGTVHGGYLDMAALCYDVYVDGKIVASDLRTTSFKYTIPEGVYNRHVATVVAKANGHSSDEAVSNGVHSGTPLPLPLELHPTEEEAKLFNIVDWNQDGYTFDYFRAYDGDYCFAYHQNASRPATDWLFLPAFEINDPDKVYMLSWDAFVGDERYPEDFDIWLGQNEPTPWGMVGGQYILRNTRISNRTPQRMSTTFKVKEAGAYFVGFRCNSEANMYLFMLRNFSINVTDISPNGPDKVTSASAKALPKGELTAEVTAQLPTLDIQGNELDLTKEITLTVESSVASASVNGLPGATVTVNIETEPGVNTLTLTTRCEDNKGKSSTLNVFTGPDRPGLVENLEMNASEDGFKLNLTWTPNEVGANGGYADHSTTSYYLCVPDGNVWRSVKNLGTGVTSCTVNLGSAAVQQLYNYGILTLNQEGQADYLNTAACVAGKPYSVPMKEDFEGNTFNVEPIVMTRPDASYTASWSFDQPYKVGLDFINNGNAALIAYAGNGVIGKGRCLFPLFSTEGTENPTFSIKFNNGGCEGKLYARTWNTEFVEIAELNETNGEYKTLTVDLPANLKNCKWVQVAVDIDIPSNYSAFVIDGYSARDPRENDLSVAKLTVAPKITIGENTAVDVKISNEGRKSAIHREGTLYVKDLKGNILQETQVAPTGSIEPDNAELLNLEIKPEIDWGNDVIVSYTLSSGDDNPENDSLSAETSVKLGNRPAVTDLHVTEVGDDFAQLEWTEPESTDGYEGFEDETPFLLSPTIIGKFKNIDMDGKKVYGMEGLPNVFEAGAFNVYSTSAINDSRFSTEWGDNFIIAYCPGEGTPSDDWLISPAVVGGTEISFNARPLTYQYGSEDFELCYSTGSDALKDFKVLETVHITGTAGQPTVWKTCKFTLPEDARYFAIHYISADKFGVMMDEFRFTPEDRTPDVTSYDIMRDGNVIADEQSAAGSYRDQAEGLSNDIHLYNVIPVLADGSRSYKSNTASTNLSSVKNISKLRSVTGTKGRIIISGFEGEEVIIADMSGVVMYSTKAASAVEEITLSAGVYAVVSKNYSGKVNVR